MFYLCFLFIIALNICCSCSPAHFTIIVCSVCFKLCNSIYIFLETSPAAPLHSQPPVPELLCLVLFHSVPVPYENVKLC